VSQEDQILQANRRFYEAFSAGDATALEACWAKHSPLLTAHPWRPALLGREAVLASWRQVLQNPPAIHFSQESVTQLGEIAVVTCLEHAGDGTLGATNLWIEEEGEWRLCHHHAGPLAPVFETPPAAIH